MRGTIVVTIGRNISGAPMDDEQWLGFRRAVQLALISNGVQIIQQPNMTRGPAGQLGIWGGDIEGAATFVGFTPNRSAQHDVKRSMLTVAYEYKQDAIGVIYVDGTEHCVYTEACHAV